VELLVEVSGLLLLLDEVQHLPAARGEEGVSEYLSSLVLHVYTPEVRNELEPSWSLAINKVIKVKYWKATFCSLRAFSSIIALINW